jgi:hypothetical protein
VEGDVILFNAFVLVSPDVHPTIALKGNDDRFNLSIQPLASSAFWVVLQEQGDQRELF